MWKFLCLLIRITQTCFNNTGLCMFVNTYMNKYNILNICVYHIIEWERILECDEFSVDKVLCEYILVNI